MGIGGFLATPRPTPVGQQLQYGGTYQCRYCPKRLELTQGLSSHERVHAANIDPLRNIQKPFKVKVCYNRMEPNQLATERRRPLVNVVTEIANNGSSDDSNSSDDKIIDDGNDENSGYVSQLAGE